MKHIIITGASGGLGNALAVKLADSSTTLHLTARSNLAETRDKLSRKGARVITYQFDLIRTDGIEILTDKIFENIDFEAASGVYLVNNAGMLEPVGPIGKHETGMYRNNLELNFVAPALLCQEFIKRTRDFTGIRRILNISSGAARSPYHGWSHYCSTKAGLDMLTRCIALEHAPKIGCAAYNPGKTDTGMQNLIRETSQDDFRNVQRFVDAWEEGDLNNPQDVAADIADLLFAEQYPDGEIIGFNR